MKKAKLLLFLALPIFIFSCSDKKDDPTPTEDPTPIVKTDTAGFLNLSYINYLDTVVWPSDTIAAAQFVDEKETPQQVTSVSLNGINLDFQPVDTSYQLYKAFDYPKCTWSVKGKGNVPDIDYTDTSPMPSYSGSAQLPDVIDPSKNLTIPLSGIKDATHIYVHFSDDQENEPIEVELNANSVTFTAAQLSKLSKGPHALSINVYHINSQNKDGKVFFFLKSAFYIKSVEIF